MSKIVQKIVNGHTRRFILDHFVYNAEVPSLAPGATVSISIPIEADSMFTAVKMSYMSDIAAAAQTDGTRVIPLIRVGIQDSGSGRNLQNTSVPINSIAGNGGLPMVLPVPREFLASSNITITFTNYSAATTYTNTLLSLIGFKSFSQA